MEPKPDEHSSSHYQRAPSRNGARSNLSVPGSTAAGPTLRHAGEATISFPARSGMDRVGIGGARRAVNVAVAAAGILLVAPLMLVIAVLIRLSGPGPIIYTQRRVGLDERHSNFGCAEAQNGRRNGDLGGRLFRIYKFRTMHVGSDRCQVWASPSDPRVTAVGRVLRCTRLDELPQLFNVLKGEMNVVGPRPEQPEIFARLRNEVPGYEMRQVVLPGITGWAQVNHGYDRSLDDVKEKVSLDLEYIGQASLTQDLRIMLRTPGVMLGRDGGW